MKKNNFSLEEYDRIHCYELHKYVIPRCVWKMIGKGLFSYIDALNAKNANASFKEAHNG